MHTQLYLNGRWRDASDGGHFPVTDPATEEVIAEVASATLEDCAEAAEAAHVSGKAWAARAPRDRAEILRRTFELMMQRRQEIAELMVRENGKCLRDAEAEVAYAAEFFRWYAEEAVRNIGEIMRSPAGGNHIVVLQQPIGVSLLITPWNFPAAMATRKIGPALAAGCGVILKPASDTPLTALLIAALLEEAGVPPGVVNVLPSRRSGEVASSLLHNPLVRKLSFTGSTEVGRSLLKEAADGIVSCSMELGGNAPFIVLDDADVDAAVQGALVAKMRNGGEACTAANRFYAHARIYEQFTERFATAMKALKMGPGLDPGVELGPMVNARAIKDIDRLVADAVTKGAEVMSGGAPHKGRGFFYPATVLGRVPAEANVLREEIFGPVAPVVVFDDDDAMIAQANDTEYGLVAYLYTQNLKRGMRVAERLEAGMVGLNRGLVSDPAAPFGGVKQSGIGREGGHDGLLEFMEKKYIAVEW